MSTADVPTAGPPAQADVVVVGAGIVGAAVAHHLAGRGVSVAVLERSDRPAAGATGRSGGMVRAFDPDPQVADLALASLEVYRDAARWPDGVVPLHDVGAVTIADPSDGPALRAAAARINAALGTTAHVVDGQPEAAGVRLVGGVALVEPEAGWVDPADVTRTWLRQAAAAGAEVCHGVRVRGFERAGSRVRVLTDAGAVLAGRVLVAVGPWAARPLLGMRRVAPVRTRSIQVSIVEGRPPGPDHATLIDLRTGGYARPYGPGRSLVGLPHLVWDAEADAAVDAEPDPVHVRATVEALAPHLPWLDGATVEATVRSTDAYVASRDGAGPEPLLSTADVPNVWAVRGWDGGGVKVAPEVGRRIADTLLAGWPVAAAPPVSRTTASTAWPTGAPVGASPAPNLDQGKTVAHCHDVIGIGFGPANIALAVALEEEGYSLDARFLEARAEPSWQAAMMLDGSDIQNHPVRDLVSLRNPRSRYSFINFLFENGRLLDHLNVPLEFPLRKEYAQYVSWVAGLVPARVDYGVRVLDVQLARDESGDRCYRVTTSQGETLFARALVVGTGRTPFVPEPFDEVASPRVFHLTDYLPALRRLDETSAAAGASGGPRSVTVIGGSQSAVELTLDLARRYPRARVNTLVRSLTLRQKDTSPFSEEGYFPEFTDYYYRASRERKDAIDSYMRLTNYSSADGDVLRELYRLVYEQRLDDDQRVFVLGSRQVRAVDARDDGVRLRVEELTTGEVEELTTDAVVLATGFRDLGPGRHQERVPALMRTIADDFRFDDHGYLEVEPHYEVRPVDPQTPALFLNGLCESTHGIGDAGSFSLLSLRAKVISASLWKRLA